MFSIVIPLYNKELSIYSTIQSILSQTFSDFEVIIVNDGSTDNSLAIVKQIKDDRIRIIDKSNGGVSSARNRGIKEVKFEWVCFLDADDLWNEDHLISLKQMIEEYPHHKVFCTSYIRSNEIFPEKRDDSVAIIEDYFKEAIRGSFFSSSTGCVHNSVFEDVGDFNIKFSRGEDLDLWARIGRKYSFVNSKKVTAVYRIEAENRSNVKTNLEKRLVFNYDFSECTRDSERDYYKKRITGVLRTFLKQLKIKQFLKLKRKYKDFISFSDIFKG